MTNEYKNVYIKNTALVVGPKEAKGNFNNYFDKQYEDFYCGEKSFELAETKLQQESINILLKKEQKGEEDINLLIAGDLLNQISASSYAASKFNIPFLGVYNACATSGEEIIIAANFIENKMFKNIICTTSSHNLSSEKQFRNPIEYGAPKPNTATYTATGGASILLTNEKSSVKVTSSTIGKIMDYQMIDPNNMGAVMAPAAAYTINKHLQDCNLKIDDYDLILTGDLGIYGKDILIEFMKKEYHIDLKNYDDCGAMLYNLEKQKEITAGGSGPVCSCLVNYGYIYDCLKTGKYKKVLLVITGALFSPTFIYQKQNILSIAHAISLESV